MPTANCRHTVQTSPKKRVTQNWMDRTSSFDIVRHRSIGFMTSYESVARHNLSQFISGHQYISYSFLIAVIYYSWSTSSLWLFARVSHFAKNIIKMSNTRLMSKGIQYTCTNKQTQMESRNYRLSLHLNKKRYSNSCLCTMYCTCICLMCLRVR